ncbi:MAG: hypothetical protein HYV02_05355 [Deltaproteobacteria bacterium]|nr:hypothetical protein [Deltaproteobacteria bacterium]
MRKDWKPSRRLLCDLLALPTAPLLESHVIAFVRRFAARYRLRLRQDRFGNIFLANRGRGRTRCVVMAHMDHPGIVVTAIHGRQMEAKILGGLHRPHMARARFRFFPDERGSRPVRVTGRIGRDHLRLPLLTDVTVGTFGMLDLPPVRWARGLVLARVIDNLAGCAEVLDWLRAFARSPHRVMGVLTRGEEIGMRGAAALVRSRQLPRHVPMLVLEASSAAAARVEIGGGPVLRVGDRLVNFDPRIDCWVQETANRLAGEDRDFVYQRALMCGGVMEASLYVLDGLLVGALALPLGNYHNRGPRGPAPEYIAWRDWCRLQQLLRALVVAPPVPQVVRCLRRRLLQAQVPERR